MRALVVDDEQDIVRLLEMGMASAGIDVESAADGQTALRLALSSPPDVVLLDRMLPDVSGLDVCRRLKRDPRTHRVPVIMVSARATAEDRVAGLEAGADDYVTKPFYVRELILRCQAVARSARDASRLAEPLLPPTAPEELSAGPLRVDMAAWRCSLSGRPLAVTAVELRLLAELARSAGRVVTREQLLSSVWQGARLSAGSRTLDVHVRRLRGKLGPASRWLQTVRKIGFRWSDPR
jgi:two-component system phosphate regulon response regulator PhoB